MLKSSLCDYSDVYIGTITAFGAGGTKPARQTDINKK